METVNQSLKITRFIFFSSRVLTRAVEVSSEKPRFVGLINLKISKKSEF